MLRYPAYGVGGMAAGRSNSRSVRRGASTGQGAEIRREGLAPFLSLPHVQTLDSLEEISGWLGTFRERLRQARAEDGAGVGVLVTELEARYQLRRAELS